MDPVVNILNLILPKPGSYEFVVRIDGRYLGSIPLSATIWHPPES